MANAVTSRLSGARGSLMLSPRDAGRFSAGDLVRVQDHRRSPLAGQSGKVARITPGDPCGPYLVQFGNGLEFRYREDELVALTS